MGAIAGEDITATLDFDNNVVATLLHHRFPSRPIIEFCGTEGRLVYSEIVSSPKHPPMWVAGPLGMPGADGGGQPLEPVYADGYDLQGPATSGDYWMVEDWVRPLDEDCDPESNGREGAHVVEVMMAIFEAAAYRRTVELPQTDRRHPLLRWRKEHGLGDPPAMPRPYDQWLAAEDRRLGR